MSNVENKRSRGRPPGFEREAVLRGAMAAFRTHGYSGTSIPVLTEAMGISAQSLYAAFGSKDALYREAITLYLRSNGAYFATALQEETDPLAAIARMFREATEVFTEQAASGCMITNAPAGPGDEPLTVFGRELRADGRRALEGHLTRGVDDGFLKPGTDVSTWARYVTCSLYGLSVQARDGSARDELLKVAEVAAGNLEALRV
jgi:AcrR family transcriptional regulator